MMPFMLKSFPMNTYHKIYIILLACTLVAYFTAVEKKCRYRQWVILYLVLALVTTVTAISLIRLAGVKNNLFLFHVYTPLEFVVLSLLFHDMMTSHRIRRLIRFTIPAFLLLCLAFSLWVQPVHSNNSYCIIIGSILIITWVLLFLREVLLRQEVTSLSRYPMFWISAGVLFYFAGHLLIEGMLNYMMSHSMALARKAYRVGYVFKYMLFGLLMAGVFCNLPPVRKPQSPE
jgi:hypothetical protein